MLIQPMLQRLQAAHDIEHLLRIAVADIVALHGAERGNIQLLNTRGQLVIVHQYGLSRTFLETFAVVEMNDGSVCGRAVSQQQSVFVGDVEQNEEFAPFLKIARSVPFRSVLSSPLIDKEHDCVGMASVHFTNRSKLSKLELTSMEEYCGEVARSLLGLCSMTELRHRAESMSAQILAAAE